MADHVDYDKTPWPIKDIIYTSVVGFVMVLALLEWFLWLASFLYCLYRVYRKAQHVSTKILAVIMSLVFTALRLIFLPVMIVTLPLPTKITQYFPVNLVNFLQWFGFWSFAGILTVPWLFCIYQLVTNQLGRTKRMKQVLDENTAPKIVIVMPCYKEEPSSLVAAIDSVVDCDYPPTCIHVFLSFDGNLQDEKYLNVIQALGVPLSMNEYPKSIDVTYRTARITVSRFPHGGKRKCQKATFKLIDRVYTEYLKRQDNLFILFIDSDCILDKVCLQNFVYDMELSPGNSKEMLAMTGVITSTTKKHSLITLLQDMEYIHGQLLERTVESGCGAVTCLPGALTMLRFSAFRKMAKYYFAEKAELCTDMFDYGKCHLGEDRWLTHLFMIGAKKRYQIQMCTSAFCKTEAVQTYGSLVKQRRRWFLGFITNEVCMLTDARIWKRYPILCLVRFMQNTIRTTALLFLVLFMSLVSNSKIIQDLPVGFIGISLGLNWAMMIYFAFTLGRYKILLYPVMFVVNPFFNWYYMVYGILTAGQRTWGGPRADAGAADEYTTPAEAIEKGEATGDDLNVIPETFKAANDGRTGNVRPGLPLQPPDSLDGRFTGAELLPGGWYRQENNSIATIGNATTINSEVVDHHRTPLQTRNSFDSYISANSGARSVILPQRVEIYMDADTLKKYQTAQANQRAAGGAYMTTVPRISQADELQESNFQKSQLPECLNSLESFDDRPVHTRADSYNSVTSTADDASDAENSSSIEGSHKVAFPQKSHTRTRTGRSPLARASMARMAPDGDGKTFEMEEQSSNYEESPATKGKGNA